MRSSSVIRPLVIAALTVVFAASCARPKRTEPDAEAGANAQANQAGAPETSPTIGNRPITMDPQGSDSGKISGLNTVYFEYDQSRLTPDTRKRLSQNAEWIKGNPSFTIQIEGHTDARGSVEYNLALGERRAKSVKSYLESLGIEGRRMTVISYGKEKPIAEGDSESAWSKNRRANFVPLQ